MMSPVSGCIPSAAITSAMQSLGALEALGRPVLERLGRGLLRDPRHLRGERLGREGRGVGQAAGERDHLGPGGDLHQVAHRRRAHHPGALREQARVALEVARRGVGAAVRRAVAALVGPGRVVVRLGHRFSVANRARARGARYRLRRLLRRLRLRPRSWRVATMRAAAKMLPMADPFCSGSGVLKFLQARLEPVARAMCGIAHTAVGGSAVGCRRCTTRCCSCICWARSSPSSRSRVLRLRVRGDRRAGGASRSPTGPGTSAALLLLVFGIWLALYVDGYEIWDGWILGALVLFGSPTERRRAGPAWP